MRAWSLVRRLPWIGIAVWLAVLSWHSWYGPDIWYHLTWGREIISGRSLTPAQRTLLTQPLFANPYWLFQTLIYCLYGLGGIYLVSMFFALSWAGVLALWLRLSRLTEKAVVGPWLFLAAAICVQLRFEERPEVLSYFFLLCHLTLVNRLEERPATRGLFLSLFAVQWLWTCCHGYFVLGPFISGLFLASVPLAQNRRHGLVKDAFLFFLISGLASVATPFGWMSWRQVDAYFHVGQELRDINVELFPPAIWPWPPPWPLPVFWLLWLILVGFAAAQLLCFATGRAGKNRREGRELYPALLALAGAFLAAKAERNIPVLVLLSAPLLRQMPAPVGPHRLLHNALSTALCAIAVLLILLSVGGDYLRLSGSLGRMGVHLEWSSYPIGAVDFLNRSGFTRGKIFADSYDGGYVEFHLPAAEVAGDSYFSDATLTRSYFTAIKDPNQLQALGRRFAFDAWIINIENLAVVDWALGDPTLSLAYADSHRLLFLPKRAFPNSADPARFTYYHGEDPRDAPYGFALSAWTAVAVRRHNKSLLLKILDDMKSAAHIPGNVLRMSYRYGIENSDREVVHAADSLAGRVEQESEEGRSALTVLQAKARACCE